MNEEDRAQEDPMCLSCCRPKSRHIARDLQCPETTYFIERPSPVIETEAPNREELAKMIADHSHDHGSIAWCAAYDAAQAALALRPVGAENVREQGEGK